MIMQMRKTVLVAIATCAASMSASGETAKECKARLGSERQCFATQVLFHQELCGMKMTVARLDGSDQSKSEAGSCGADAKKEVRQFYDAVLAKASKKPAAQAAAKKVMLAFIAVMAEPPGTITLKNNLTTALAELELELP